MVQQNFYPPPEVEGVSVTLPPLGPVAELAGYQLPEADLVAVASLLDGIIDDIQKLRELDLGDEVEPVLTFRVEPWT